MASKSLTDMQMQEIIVRIVAGLIGIYFIVGGFRTFQAKKARFIDRYSSQVEQGASKDIQSLFIIIMGFAILFVAFNIISF